MLTAKEANANFLNSKLIKFLDDRGQETVLKASKSGKNNTSFFIEDAPSDLSRVDIAVIAIKFYKALGYKADTDSKNRIMYLEW